MNGSKRALWWLGALLGAIILVSLALHDWRQERRDVENSIWTVWNSEQSGFKMPFPKCEIAKNGLSPNRQGAFILIPPQPDDGSNISNVFNCVMTRAAGIKYLQMPTSIQTSSVERTSYDGMVRWAPDSSSVLCFKNSVHSEDTGVFCRGAYDIYVVPIANGLPQKPVSLEMEILKLAFPTDAARATAGRFKDIPDFYILTYDEGFDDNLTFNATNQIVIDCVCTSTPRNRDGHPLDKPPSPVRITALWDPVREEFARSNVNPIPATN